MKTWTDVAERRLEQYLNERVNREGLSGEDATELRDDLRRHIHEEVEGDEAIITCGVMNLETVLGRLDAGYESTRTEYQEWPLKVRANRGGGWLWFFAVILPLIVILLEWVTKMCANVFLDPIPSVLNGLLLLSVPITHLALLKERRDFSDKSFKIRSIVAGAAFGTSLFYALLYLPFLPFSLFLLLAIGMGLLPMSPILAWIGSWKISRMESQQATDSGYTKFRKMWLIGGFSAIALLLLNEAPNFWTRTQVANALSEDENAADKGLRALRFYHSDDMLLRMCYENSSGRQGNDISGWILNGIPGIWGSSRSISEGTGVRDLYFRVTGHPFNSQRPPRWVKGSPFDRGSEPRDMEEFEWDSDHGGDAVAARIKYLDCKESRFDGHLDSKAGLGYGEWTLVFHNGGALAREARCQVRLPHGGQVSRLTLWINGEPREAAFGSVSQVKAAYKEVAVTQRRDPVLVNMVGPDTIMVQCFPVPARGEMKIRIGMTAPLENGAWKLPEIIEQNFGSAASLQHAVWMQSDAAFTCLEGQSVSNADGDAQSMAWENKQMGWTLKMDNQLPFYPVVWCEDPFAEPLEHILIGKKIEGRQAPIDSCIVVVDGSLMMKDAAAWISRSLSGKAVKIFLANDASREIQAKELATYKFQGGCNNEPALYAALCKARESSHSAVIWLHGPQPVELTKSERLMQILERGNNHPDVYAVNVVKGPNRLFEKMGRSGLIKSAPGNAATEEGLSAWISQLAHGSASSNWVWSRQLNSSGIEGEKVSDQLARLWAMNEVAKTRNSALAVKYQLVSYVSGAVVLENMEQYKQHGLTPVDEITTPKMPNVPEPSSWLLLLLTTVMACFRRKRCAA